MAIKLVVKDQTIPYVVSFDRESPNPTVFNLYPMDNESAALFRAKFRAAEQEYNIPVSKRARNSVSNDRETLIGQIESIENITTDPEEVVRGEDVAKIVNEGLDYVTIQELMTACQSMALLEAGRRKS